MKWFARNWIWLKFCLLVLIKFCVVEHGKVKTKRADV